MAESEWEKVKTLFYAALPKSPGARVEFLDRTCGQNSSIRSQVDSLLDSYKSGFLEERLFYDPLSQASPSRQLFEPGFSFSHYEIVKLLGRGGMGEVYLADDTALDRLVAIKIIHDDSGLGEHTAFRLLREAHAAAKLDHPNIAAVYEVGETNGRPFVAMQYVAGETLQFLIAQESITYDDAISYTRQIAAALSKAHSAGLVHRDIKPANVIVDQQKQLKVLDFGLAKETAVGPEEDGLSAVGLIAGTLSYMSPEHLRAQEINGQTDIWSLGVVLHQMITGNLPFQGESKADLISNVLHSDFEPVTGLPPAQRTAVNHVLHHALQKDRSVRYATVSELDADLAELSSGGSLDAGRRATDLDRPKVFANTRTLKHLVIAGSLLLIMAGGIGIWQIRRSDASEVPVSERFSGNLQFSGLFDMKRTAGAAITDLRFAPDGNTLSFALSDADASSIYILPVSGGVPSRLTEGTSNDHSPVWSPDARDIAFVSNREGKAAIWTVPRAGGRPNFLVSLESESLGYPQLRKWSNDGTRIFIASATGPKVIDIRTGAISNLDVGGITGYLTRHFSISHDESKLMVVSSENGTERLWLKVVGTNEAKVISGTAPPVVMPDWFPDDLGYAFSADDNGSFQIYVRNLDGSGARQITFSNFSASNPVVAPDGRQIAYVTNIDQADIFRIDIGTEKQTRLTQNVNMQLFPAVSPDGNHLAYQSISESSKLTSGLLRIDWIEGQGARPNLTLSQAGCCIQWAPNGQEVAFIRRVGGNFGIYSVALGSQAETALSLDGIAFPAFSIAPFDLMASPFAWTPDGSAVTYISKISGHYNVWTVARDGSRPAMVTAFQDDTIKPVSPTWSPDGARIAFVETTTPGSARQRTENRIAISQNGTKRVIATFELPITLVGWTKTGDGIFVAVAKRGNYDVFLVPADGSRNNRRVARLRDARSLGIRISPDQRWIAYGVTRNNLNNVCITPVTGGSERCITSNDDSTLFYSGLNWTPDSKGLLYSKQTGGMQISLISQQ